jgi:hypothetical protein
MDNPETLTTIKNGQSRDILKNAIIEIKNQKWIIER